MSDATDREVVEAVLKGDTARFGTLVDRYSRLVRAVAMGRGVAAADADDVAQEAFLAAYTRLWQLRDSSGFPSWLARIAHRRAGTWLRRAESARAREREMARPDTLSAPQDEVDDEIDSATIVSAALASLSETLRLPLALHYYADASPSEIARHLSLTRNAVDARLSRAREQLRDHLRRRGLEGDARALVRSVGPAVLASGPRLTSTVMEDVGEGNGPVVAPAPPSLSACAFGATAFVASFVALAGVSSVTWADLRAESGAARIRMDRGTQVFLLPAPTTATRFHVAPGRELDGWEAIDPRRDSASPRRVGASDYGGPVAQTSNAYGVRKTMEPTVGEVTLRLRLKTPPAPMSAIVGFTFYGSDSAQAVFWKNETNFWHYNSYTDHDTAVQVGPVEDVWRDVVIVYRTWSGAYDLFLDGELIAEDAVCASGLAGVPVTGVSLSSGRGASGWPLLFAGMRVSSRDGEALRVARPARDLEPQPPPRRDRMALHSGELAGQYLDPRDPRVTVSPGDRIAGWLDVSVLNTHGDSAGFHVVETPSWGDPSLVYRRVAMAATSGQTRHTVHIDRRAPTSPGTYRLILAGAAETQPEFVASGTNWPIGEPLWGHGTDVAGWSDELVREAVATGGVIAPWVHEPYEIASSEVAAAAVEVVVE